jgi:hypothetical protein
MTNRSLASILVAVRHKRVDARGCKLAEDSLLILAP